MNPNKNLNLSIKIDGIDKAVTNTDLLTNNIDELKGLFTNLNGSMKSISDSFKDFAKVNSEVKDELKKVTNNTKEASGGFSELFEHFRESKIRSTIKTASNELLQYTAGAILAGKTASESIGEVSSSISSTLFATGNLYATIGGAALMLVTPLIQSIFELSDAEKERQEALKRTVEIAKKANESHKNVYASATKEIVTNISALDKLRAVESKNIKSIKNRTEVTKELAKQISVATGYTEAEVLALSKTEEGYNRLTEAIKRNAMVRAQIGQLQTSIESTAEVEAEYTRAQIAFTDLASLLEPLINANRAAQNALDNYNGTSRDARSRLQRNANRAGAALENNENYKQYLQASSDLEAARKAVNDNSKYVASIISASTSTDNLSSTNKALIDAINRLELSLPNGGMETTSAETVTPSFILDAGYEQLLQFVQDSTEMAKLSLAKQQAIFERLNEQQQDQLNRLGKSGAQAKREEELREEIRLAEERRLLLTKNLNDAYNKDIKSTNDLQDNVTRIFNTIAFANQDFQSKVRSYLNTITNSTDSNKFIEEMKAMTGYSINDMQESHKQYLLDWQRYYNERTEAASNLNKESTNISKLESELKNLINNSFPLNIEIARQLQDERKLTKQIQEELATELINGAIDAAKSISEDNIDIDSLDAVKAKVRKEIKDSIKNDYEEVYEAIRKANIALGAEAYTIDDFGGIEFNSSLLKEFSDNSNKLIEETNKAMDKINNYVSTQIVDYPTRVYEEIVKISEDYGNAAVRSNYRKTVDLRSQYELLKLELDDVELYFDDLISNYINLFNKGELSYDEAFEAITDSFNIQKSTYIKMRDLQREGNEEILKQTKELERLYSLSGGRYSSDTSDNDLQTNSLRGDDSATAILNSRTNLRVTEGNYDMETVSKLKEIDTKMKESLDNIKKTTVNIKEEILNFTDQLMTLGSTVMDFMDVLTQNTIDKLTESISEIEGKLSETSSKLSQLEGELSQVTSGRRDATIAQIEREEQRERELAAEKIKLEKQLELEERKQFNRRKAWAISEALINGALTITALAARNPPPSPLFFIGAGLSAAITAVQVATISAQRFKRGGYTEAIGNTDHTGSRVAGVVHENEYVVPEYLLKNPEVSSIVGTIERMRLSGKADLKGLSQSLSGKNNTNDLQIKQLYDTINKVASRPSIVDVRDINNSQYNLQVKVRDNSL